MATDPYLSKQSVGGLVERCVNTPPPEQNNHY